MLLALAALSFAPAAPLARTAALRRQTIACAAADDTQMLVLKRLQDSFWSQKKARMKANMEAQLRELEEFEAREAALASAVGSSPMLGESAELASLQAELEAERAMRLALEEELQSVREQAEINLQKTSAFWIAKLANKGIAAAPSAAPSQPRPPTAGPVPNVKILKSDISLTELRSRLLSYGLSTIGLKAELIDRLEHAMEHDRLKFNSWDSKAQAWV